MRRLACLMSGLALLLAGCALPGSSAEDPTTTVAPPSSLTASTTTTSIAVAPTTTSSTTTTVAPTTTQASETTSTTLMPVRDLEAGLFCRDLEAMGYTYEDAMHYWVLEGETDRMDADRNGIPCETVWPEHVVTAYWGDPLPTSTTTPAGPYLVLEPTYQPPSEPGAGDLYGSGCSPGSTSLPDGVWFGRVESISRGSVEFDLMCFGPGPEGPGTITNSNPKLRTVDVDSDAVVYAIGPDGGWMLLTWDQWYASPQNAAAFCPPEGCWHLWLYVNDGRATEIVQLWFA